MSNERIGDLPSKAHNPANTRAKRVTATSRVPMSLPVLKLEVPEVEGWHLHWFLARNVPRALQAGYEYVDQEEVAVNNLGVADSVEESGSTDLGTRVSIIGGFDDKGESERLYLMKLPNEWWTEDQQRLAERNDKVAQAMRGGLLGADKDPDAAKRYLKQGQDLFIPKKR